MKFVFVGGVQGYNLQAALILHVFGVEVSQRI